MATTATLTKKEIKEACDNITSDLGYSDMRAETIEACGDYETIDIIETISSYENETMITDELHEHINTNTELTLHLKNVLES